MVNKAKKQGTNYETNIVNRLNKVENFKSQRFAEGGSKDLGDIQLFAERLVSVKDKGGRGVTDRFFDPDTVDIDDFEFAEGGRVPFFVGGAARMGFQALRKYGFTGREVSRLFGKMSADKTMVGPEKTEYFKQLNKVLKNPDDYPDAIKDLQKQLGIDIGTGFRNGGLAGILEV